MAHPCAASNKKKPAFCNRGRKKKRKSAASCKCPSGWKSMGIMCTQGRKKMRSSCAATLGGRKKKRRARR